MTDMELDPTVEIWYRLRSAADVLFGGILNNGRRLDLSGHFQHAAVVSPSRLKEQHDSQGSLSTTLACAPYHRRFPHMVARSLSATVLFCPLF